MKDSYCGEYTTYSQKVRNLVYTIKYNRDILNDSNLYSSNLSVIFRIEHILEGLSNYENKISKKCQSALNDIRNIRSDNGRALFKKGKKQLNSRDIDKIKGVIDEVIKVINEELPKEEELDEIEKALINKKYSNKQLGEAVRNHAREIVYILCSEDNATNKIVEPTIGKKLEELLHYLEKQRNNLLSPYYTKRDVVNHVYGLLKENNLIRNGINHSVVYKNCFDTFKKIHELFNEYYIKNRSNKTFSAEDFAGIINPLIGIIAQNIPQEKRTDKIQQIVLSEQFLHLEGAIARCSRKIAQTISSEMQLIEDQNRQNGEAISTEEVANR